MPALSKMAKTVLKKPAASGSLKKPAAVGSINQSIEDMKQAAKMKTGDEGESEQDCEDGEDIHRDKGKSIKYRKMRDSLPEFVVDLVENQAQKAASPRAFQTECINKMFKRNKSGKLELTLEGGIFQQHKKLYKEKFQKDESIVYPESIIKGMFFGGSDSKFEAALAKREIKQVESEDADDEARYFAFRTMKVGTKRGFKDENQIGGHKKVDKDTAEVLKDALQSVGWYFKYSNKDAMDFANGKRIPENIKKVLENSLLSQEKLAKEGLDLTKSWSFGDSPEFRQLKKGCSLCKTYATKIQHIIEFRELPDEQEMNKENFDALLVEMAKHTEAYNSLVESCKGRLNSRSN